jgi:hypothetical protein
VKVTSIGVTLEKRVGDNDYGSERAEVHLTAELSAADDYRDALSDLLVMAREHISADLMRSPTLVIRRKMANRPRLCDQCQQPLSDDEDYEHAPCGDARREREQRERAEREAKWAEERAERERQYARPTGQNGEDIEAEQDLGADDPELVGVSTDDEDDF